jgi:hypothetical protein
MMQTQCLPRPVRRCLDEYAHLPADEMTLRLRYEAIRRLAAATRAIAVDDDRVAAQLASLAAAYLDAASVYAQLTTATT